MDEPPKLRIAGEEDTPGPERPARVIPLRCITYLDFPADHVLRQALEADLESVVVIGFAKDGSEFAASSIADGGTVVWLLERTKTKLLAVPDSDLFQTGRSG